MQLLYLGPAEMLPTLQASLPQDFLVTHGADERTVDGRIENCDIVLDAYMKIHFKASRLERARKLKLFITATTGADHVDSRILGERGIPLLTLRGQTDLLKDITAAAEHSWLLLMACARRLPSAIQEVLAGGWDRNKYPGLMLNGRTLGIIGCGRIGQWMAAYGTAFGMVCLGHDPFVDSWPAHLKEAGLEELLQASDIITVHVPLIPETRLLLGVRQMTLIKRGAILVNTSRGEVIDEAALLAALQKGRLAAAGLDVLVGEPEIGHHPLVEYARENTNLIITPHIGGFSPDALKRVLEFSCHRIAQYFERPA